MRFELEPFHQNVPDDQFLSDMKAVAAKLSKPSVTYREYQQHGTYHPSSISTRFGGWNAALSRAGLTVEHRNFGFTDEEFFENIERIWRTLGRQPKMRDVAKPHSAVSASAYERKFGSWRKALEAFVAYINAAGDDTDEAPLLQQVQDDNRTRKRTSRNIGWRLRFKVMQRDKFRCRLCGASPATDLKIQLVVDHVQAWSKGGETVFENLQTCCETCNGGKSNLPLKAGG